jgi:hypothetical protein
MYDDIIVNIPTTKNKANNNNNITPRAKGRPEKMINNSNEINDNEVLK